MIKLDYTVKELPKSEHIPRNNKPFEVLWAFAESGARIAEIKFVAGVDYKNASICRGTFAHACRAGFPHIATVIRGGRVFLVRKQYKGASEND